MPKTCKEWIRKQLKTKITGKEFEVRLENRKIVDWMFTKNNNVLIIEDKEINDINFNKAIIQVNNYGSSLVNKYNNVITIAVKEINDENHQVAVYYNGKRMDNHPKNSLNSLEWYFNQIDIKFDKEKLIKNISELNNKLHKYDIADNIRSSISSTFLVCINKNMELSVTDSIASIKIKVKDSLRSYCCTEKTEDLNKWKKIETLYDRFKLDLEKQKSFLIAGHLYEIWLYIKHNIYLYIKNCTTKGYDIMSLFFSTFSKYALSNDKGQYFTPDHISSLMVKLIDVNVNSVVLDSTCGSGTFLTKCMDMMISQANNNEKLIQNIKQNQIYGIEKDITIYGLATANMLLHKDGRSNIENDDCFNYLPKLKNKKINRLIMNPPYNVKNSKPELKFLLDSLDVLDKEGKAVIILPTSCATSDKNEKLKNELMQKHTLNAVMTCPPELFNPSASTHTCIMVFTAHVPHKGKVYLADWKNDLHYKTSIMKNDVRICDQKKWTKRESEWLKNYKNKDGLLVDLNYNDNWLYENHLKIDYSKISEKDFVKRIRQYVAFKIENNIN